MNYITMLREQVEQARRREGAVLLAALELRQYLQSSKFHQDPTVQTADVLRRLQHVIDGVFVD